MKKQLLFFFIFVSALTYGQCDEIYLKGRVVDTLMSQNYYYNLMVINQTTKQGVYGRPNGEFSVYARAKDRIGFSTKGYENIYIEIPDSEVCSIDTVIYLNTRVQQFEEVVVYRVKSLEEIKKEREELSMRETRTVTGINVLESPITALYERFSKTAKTKRLIAEMEHQDNINSVVKNLLRAYVSYDVVYLEEEEFSAFIDFLNMDEYFLRTSTDYELILYIQGKLEHYKIQNPGLFNRN